jgi:hypothetical protein
MANSSPKSRDVPKSALRFAVEDVEVGDNGANAKTAPVKMVARTGDPIQHWFWGNVVHDLAGMQLSKPRLPIDYCHDDDEVLGYLNKFDTSSGDLVVSGALTPFTDDDCASEVIYKAKAGVPYEASINFCGGDIVLEEVPPGFTTTVNGRQFDGPGVIVRKWTLRGVAICPYGADPGTETELKESSDTITVHFQEHAHMSQQTTPAEAVKAVETEITPPEAAPAAVEGKTAEAAPAEAVTLSASEPVVPAVEAKFVAADYIAAFGDTGARWFCEGKSFAKSAAEFVAKLRDDHKADVEAKAAQFKSEKDALQAEIDGLKAKLTGAPRGDQGVTFSNGDGNHADAKAAKLASNVGDNTARFAAGIQLPGQPKPK